MKAVRFKSSSKSSKGLPHIHEKGEFECLFALFYDPLRSREIESDSSFTNGKLAESAFRAWELTS